LSFDANKRTFMSFLVCFVSNGEIKRIRITAASLADVLSLLNGRGHGATIRQLGAGGGK
jgi:hypothetical protein